MDRSSLCGNCKSWKALERKGFGECHRYAPRSFGPWYKGKDETVSDRTEWPITAANDWCDEFKEKSGGITTTSEILI